VTRFYVAENPEGEPALYRRVNNEDPEELVSGVERLDIRYGLDTDRTYDLPSPLPSDPECDIEDFGDGEIDEYVEASGIDDDKCEWGKVIGARISLLIRSREDDVMPDQQTVRFAGQDLNFSDGHMRHVVNSTVAFRNKLR
jgi:type IV pilus assembly protein PilW